MDNHFHLRVRVPHRPEGFDVPLEVIVARLDRALGEESAELMHRNLEFWQTTKNWEAIEAWRQRQVDRMFSLSEFMKAIQLRFSRWFNLRNGRRGTLGEGRYTSVIVEEEERALRTIAAYIDLNPVRAGMVADPADYRWSGYSEAMSGKARSRRGLVRIIGQMAWPRATASEAKPWGDDPFPKAVETRALVFYRAILGGQGAERKRGDGTVFRRGLSLKVREKAYNSQEPHHKGERGIDAPAGVVGIDHRTRRHPSLEIIVDQPHRPAFPAQGAGQLGQGTLSEGNPGALAFIRSLASASNIPTLASSRRITTINAFVGSCSSSSSLIFMPKSNRLQI